MRKIVQLNQLQNEGTMAILTKWNLIYMRYKQWEIAQTKIIKRLRYNFDLSKLTNTHTHTKSDSYSSSNCIFSIHCRALSNSITNIQKDGILVFPNQALFLLFHREWTFELTLNIKCYLWAINSMIYNSKRVAFEHFHWVYKTWQRARALRSHLPCQIGLNESFSGGVCVRFITVLYKMLKMMIALMNAEYENDKQWRADCISIIDETF